MSALFVIAREDPMDARLAAEAERLGWSVLRLPLLATEPGPDRARFLDWLQTPPPGSVIAWTSRRAAEALAEIALPRFRETLARMALFAVGEESAAAIRGAGFTVDFLSSGGGAAALADWILVHRDSLGIARVAFLHGDKALPILPDALRVCARAHPSRCSRCARCGRVRKQRRPSPGRTRGRRRVGRRSLFAQPARSVEGGPEPRLRSASEAALRSARRSGCG